MKESTKNNIKTYIIAIAIPLAVGLLSAFLTKDNMSLYSEINSPPLAPPAWLFPVAWTVLYVLMGISSALVYIDRKAEPIAAKAALTSYAVSLVFNFFWSIIFFNLRAYLFAFLWLAAMLYFIIRTILLYKKVKPLAAYLQLPYALWVAFAGYLNIAIYFLNM